MAAFKAGSKEMKKSFKQVDIDNIEVCAYACTGACILGRARFIGGTSPLHVTQALHESMQMKKRLVCSAAPRRSMLLCSTDKLLPPARILPTAEHV